MEPMWVDGGRFGVIRIGRIRVRIAGSIRPIA
jgi:hypothetical protein